MQLCMSNVRMHVFMNMYANEDVCNFNPLSLCTQLASLSHSCHPLWDPCIHRILLDKAFCHLDGVLTAYSSALTPNTHVACAQGSSLCMWTSRRDRKTGLNSTFKE